MVTCTLTIKDDTHGEYEDDVLHQRADRQHVQGIVGGSHFTRCVVRLLKDWVANHPDCHRSELMLLGMGLYRMAFGDAEPLSADAPPLQRAFEKTYCFKQQKLPKDQLSLRLVLEERATELATFPWEFLYMPLPDRGGFFLAGENTQLRLTRYVPNADTWTSVMEDTEDDRLRILIVVSTTHIRDMTELRVSEFVQHMMDLDKTLFQTEKLPSPTRQELREAIGRLRPHIIHFIGHGHPGYLALRKDDETLRREREEYEDAVEHGEHPPGVSEAEWVDSHTANGLLHTGLDSADAPSRLVFLHACEGAAPDETQNSVEGFTSLARELVGLAGISGVVAMQYPIGVEEAEVFARLFYTYISQGYHVDVAVALARKKLAENPLYGRQEWDSRSFGTPVFYLRREDPLVTRHPGSALGSKRSESGQFLSKEPCPNPSCPSFVIRAAVPAECRSCHYPFVSCPRENCPGLVVPKPGFGCSRCDYQVGEQKPAQPGARRTVAVQKTRPEASFEPVAQRGAVVAGGPHSPREATDPSSWPYVTAGYRDDSQQLPEPCAPEGGAIAGDKP